MKQINKLRNIAVLGLFLLLIASCTKKESLQRYYVDNSEKEGFISLDIPSSMIDISKVQLTDDQKEAYNSIKKLNVLALPVTDDNRTVYEKERTKINTILARDNYHDLMRLSDKGKRAVVKYLGDEDAIDEVIFFGSDNDRGFALVRILGKGMNPEKMVAFIKIIEKADVDDGQFDKLKEILGK